MDIHFYDSEMVKHDLYQIIFNRKINSIKPQMLMGKKDYYFFKTDVGLDAFFAVFWRRYKGLHTLIPREVWGCAKVWRFCPRVPVHNGIAIVLPLFRIYSLCVAYCLVFCITSCVPVQLV